MVKKKGKSKRTTLKQKFKVQKRVKEHHRKQKKEAKRKGQQVGTSKKKRDPGIPNSWPFKAELLAQLEAAKATSSNKKKSVQDIVSAAKLRNETFEKKQNAPKENDIIVLPELDRSRKAYGKQIAQLIESTDVVLEVLDARDPLSSHSEELESQILPPKRLILILNKIDLIPQDIAQRWLHYLRKVRGFIVMPCAARPSSKTKVQDLGLDSLLQLLKSFAREARLAVAVVGFPNTGKSSLVQALVRRRSSDHAVTGIDATAGSTTSVREVRLDKKVTLIDSPGVIRIRPHEAVKHLLSLAARGSIEATDLADAPSVAANLLRRCTDQDALKRILGGAQTSLLDTTEPLSLLATLGRARGRLKKSGVVDLDAAAKDLLADFKSGRLPFYVEPPAIQQSAPIEVKLVDTMSDTFDPLAQDEVKVLSATALASFENAAALDLYNDDKNDVDMGNDEDDDDDEDMENDDDAYDFQRDFSYSKGS